MILDKKGYFDALDRLVGEDATDEMIAIIENMSDTYLDMEQRATDQTDWKQKYQDLDDSWKKRYRKRFFSGTDSIEIDTGETVDPTPDDITTEDLFEEVE